MKIEFDVFNKENLGQVRTVYDPEEDEIWFFANDVAKILGYKNASESIADHTDIDDRKALKYKAYSKTLLAELWGKNDYMDKIFINESGLYCLIFGSKLESAKEFKLWVTKEVLPSIRKNGGYILGQEHLAEDEKEQLLAQIKRLSKDVSDWKADADYWLDQYFAALNKDVSDKQKKEPETEKADSNLVTADGLIFTKALWEVLNAAE